jgi:hypothetical protein
LPTLSEEWSVAVPCVPKSVAPPSVPAANQEVGDWPAKVDEGQRRLELFAAPDQRGWAAPDVEQGEETV